LPLLKRQPELYPADLFGPPPPESAAALAADPAAPPLAHAPRTQRALQQPWWVAHVRSRQEKALARHLLQWEIPFYLPQRERRFRAGDRWRTSHLPLFTSYVFVRGGADERLTARKTNLTVQMLDVLDQHGMQRELRSLWLLQLTGSPLVPHPYLGPGDDVEVTAGALRGYRGKVLREKGKYRLVVSITLLRQSVAADVDRSALAPAAMRKVG
jgi:transcriptional antiterminator RfaH